MKVFVYGTLRRNHGNYLRLLENRSTYLGDGETMPYYTMLHLGGFPGVVEGGKTSIKGEVFEISETVRKDLDRLEGHPHFYKRTPITLLDETEAEIYLIVRDSRPLSGYATIESGDWNNRDKPRDTLGLTGRSLPSDLRT